MHLVWLARDCPQLNKKEREWRRLKRDSRSHLARSLWEFADEVLTGLTQLGGERVDLVDHVPAWFLEDHKRVPTGRSSGRPKGGQGPPAPRQDIGELTRAYLAAGSG